MTILLLACMAAFLFGVAFVPNIVRADENAAAVSIHVTDSNGAELSGASLSVIGSNGAAKDTWISGSAVHTVDLLPGNYTLEETASPENYSKLDTAFPFTVQEDGTIAAEGLNQEGVIQVTVSGKEITIAAAPLTNDRGASDSSAESTAKIAAVPETAASTFSPEANITQEDVLGDAIEYGVTASVYEQRWGDAETNVAAKKAICLTQTGNDLTAGDSQKFMFGQVDQSFVIEGKVNTQVVCPDSERSKVIAHDGVHLSFQSMSQRAVNSSMDAMIQSAAQKSSAFAAKTPNAELSIGQDQKYHLDLTASPAGAYYVDLPDAAMTESDKLHITKNSNQSVILTNRSSGTVNLQKFNLNGVGTDTLTKASGYEESKNIYLNFPNAKTINLNGSVIGNLLAANASVYVYGTGAGHIVSDKVIIESGEWHNIDQVDRGKEHHPEVTGVTVKKVWDDQNNQDGKRPKSVKVKLLADGKNADSENAFVSLSEDNKWTYSWNNLPAKKDGKEITYTVKEENVPEGYEASVTEDS